MKSLFVFRVEQYEGYYLLQCKIVQQQEWPKAETNQDNLNPFRSLSTPRNICVLTSKQPAISFEESMVQLRIQ